jgi:amino acid transporter
MERHDPVQPDEGHELVQFFPSSEHNEHNSNIREENGTGEYSISEPDQVETGHKSIENGQLTLTGENGQVASRHVTTEQEEIKEGNKHHNNVVITFENHQSTVSPGSADRNNNDNNNDNALIETVKKKPHSIFSLVAIVYFLVCGGAYGTEDLGGSVPPLFALLGILIIPWVWSFPVAMITAELASAMPSDSGFLCWGRRAWPPFIVFLDGWIMILIIIFDQALYPIIFVAYVQDLIPMNWWQQYLVNLVYIAVCCIINLMGAKTMGTAAKIFTILALLPFVFFVFAGFGSSQFDPEHWFKTSNGQEWNLGLYLSVLVWATCGFEYSGFLAGDVENPRRTFPVTMFIAVVLMVSTYAFPIAIAIATSAELRMDVGQYSYPELALNLGLGSWILYMMIGGGLMSTMGTYNAYLHTSSCALKSLSLDGMAPAIFSALPQYRMPVIPIIFFSLTTATLVLFDFSAIVEAESYLYCIHALLLCSTFIKLNLNAPELGMPRYIPFGKRGAIVAALFPICILVMVLGAVTYNSFYVALLGLTILCGCAGMYACRVYAFGWVVPPSSVVGAAVLENTSAGEGEGEAGEGEGRDVDKSNVHVL